MVSRSNATLESRYLVEKPAGKPAEMPAVKAERGLLATATEGEGERKP
jgi:hypothetical protein